MAITVTASAQALSPSYWSLGVGVASFDRPYRGDSREHKVLPFLVYESERISVRMNQADLKVASMGSLTLKLRGRYAFGEGYKPADSDYLTGMAKRKGSAWFGAAADWQTPLVNLHAELLATPMHSKGRRVTVGLDRRFSLGHFGLTPRLNATWLDRDYVDYYYGVRSSEATLARPAYSGSSTRNVELGLQASYEVTPRQSVILDVSTTRFGGGITASPLVDRSRQDSASIRYLVRF